MTAPRPYALLAELTYRCPLHCPYCSNPTQLRSDHELTTDEWRRVFREASELGVLQTGFSGGEPLVRRDLSQLVRGARDSNLYANLITSGVGLDENRAKELLDAGLDSVQLSFQSDDVDLADEIAGGRAHRKKLEAAAAIRAAGISLSLNFVIHRHNIDRLSQMIDLTETLGAERVELANVQFYGWAFLNRAALLPTREQVDRAREVATAAKARLAGKIDIFYVLPDYYETRPKPCLNGWGQRYLTVNPIGDVLPCPTASSAIPDMRFENVRATIAGMDLARIGKFQSFPRNRMDARAVPELPAKRNRFRRLPVSGGVADRKCREHGPGLHVIAKSRADRFGVGRNQPTKRRSGRLEISKSTRGVNCGQLFRKPRPIPAAFGFRCADVFSNMRLHYADISSVDRAISVHICHGNCCRSRAAKLAFCLGDISSR